MSAVLIDDEIVHYEVLGRGRPLVFLHGWVSSWRYWIPTMQATSTSFRTYALDLWGFGDTAKKTINYTLNEQTRLVERFLDNMGIGKIALVGHGLGALVGVDFTARHPHSVDRLMAVCLPLEGANLHPRLRNSSPADLGDWMLSREALSDATRAEVLKVDPLAIFSGLDDLAVMDVMGAVLRLNTPCLLVYGQNDPTHIPVPAESALDLAEHTHKIVFDLSGHFPMLDEPSKFNRLLSDFLALNSGESPRQLQLKDEWKRRVR